MILYLARHKSDAFCTIGDLFVDAVHECFTLEDVVREPKGWRDWLPADKLDAAVLEWKVPHKTAIPEGRYRITLVDSPRFGPDTITINKVPGFLGIRMHSGNTADDTDGCPIVGDRITTDRIQGGRFNHVLDKLKAKIKAELDSGEEVWIEISNP